MNDAVVIPGHHLAEWLIAAVLAFALSRERSLSRFLHGAAIALLLGGLAAWLEVSGYRGDPARLGTIALLAFSRRRADPPPSPAALLLRAAVTLVCAVAIASVASSRWFFAALALHSGFQLLFGEAPSARGVLGEIRRVAEYFAISSEAFVVFSAVAVTGSDDRSMPAQERIPTGLALVLVGLAPLLGNWTPGIPPEGMLVLVAILLATGRVLARSRSPRG